MSPNMAQPCMRCQTLVKAAINDRQGRQIHIHMHLAALTGREVSAFVGPAMLASSESGRTALRDCRVSRVLYRLPSTAHIGSCMHVTMHISTVVEFDAT